MEHQTAPNGLKCHIEIDVSNLAVINYLRTVLHLPTCYPYLFSPINVALSHWVLQYGYFFNAMGEYAYQVPHRLGKKLGEKVRALSIFPCLNLGASGHIYNFV